MSEQTVSNLAYFQFRDLHPNVFMGTASDRYAGWIGQIYSGERYANRISRRSKKVGTKTFLEEVLPVESVEEYFRHFRVLEFDFTFYRPLLDKDGKATQNLHVLRTYTQYLNKTDRLILKVPQAIFAKRMWRKGNHIVNEDYLNPDIFTRLFYKPALGLLAAWLDGLIFEQEYQRKQDRPSPKKLAGELDTFFSAIPRDTRYHVELRTESLLTDPVFEILAVKPCDGGFSLRFCCHFHEGKAPGPPADFIGRYGHGINLAESAELRGELVLGNIVA